MRRLSIIDLVTGHQPISNEDGSIWIVFNGEIYNFCELRDDLVARGHTFQTQTDTEAIVHLYEDMGEACVELKGCRQGGRDCAACRLAQLCPEGGRGREEAAVGRS